MASPPHVVIIGGGFGGLAAARALRGSPTRVTLIDRRNHHLFQPLLYQVATAGLAPSDIAEPIRSVLRRQPNAEVRLAQVTEVDLDGQRVQLNPVGEQAPASVEWLGYDRLIVAAGVRHSYFGHDEWEPFAPGLKTIGDALDIRRRVLTAFERAEWATDPEERARCLTFVVIGGGPTGVELAGALAEIAMATLTRDFRHIRTERSRVILVEGGPAVLAPYPERLRQRARQQLEALGVEVRVSTLVTGIDEGGVWLGDDRQRLPAATVLWAAGVAGSPLAQTLGVPLDRAGRVPVGEDCAVADHPDVFVIGDLARFDHTPDGQPLPGVAPVATQMGRFVGRTIIDELAGGTRGAFRYVDKGSMATIGRSKAVVDAMGLQLSGTLAWLAWVFVHVLFLVTFRNKVLVMTKWAWAWVTFERASRLIWQGETSSPEAPQVEQERTGTG